MVNFPGRNARRRRVLNDEVLSASGARLNVRSPAEDAEADPPPRYSDAAGVEHHPQITDFVPRRYRTIFLLVLAGCASAGALAALHFFAATMAALAGEGGVSAFDFSARGSIASWLSAVVLLITAALCVLIYSIRRHRIDDIRGRYRVWLSAAAMCLVLSANSVAGLHDVLVGAFGTMTGWSVRGGAAMWPLAVIGLPFAWLAFRALLDVRESRLAATLLVAAMICYSAAFGGSFRTVQFADSHVVAISAAATALVGHWLLLAAALSYARFVVLDAQGLIPARRPSAKKIRISGSTSSGAQDGEDSTILSTAGFQNRKPTSPKGKDAEKAWIDGSRPERDSYGDEADDETSHHVHKLSKAGRKRLRKLKAERRAA